MPSCSLLHRGNVAEEVVRRGDALEGGENIH